MTKEVIRTIIADMEAIEGMSQYAERVAAAYDRADVDAAMRALLVAVQRFGYAVCEAEIDRHTRG